MTRNPKPRPGGIALLTTALVQTVRHWRYVLCVTLPITIVLLGVVYGINLPAIGLTDPQMSWVIPVVTLLGAFLIIVGLGIANAVGWHRLVAQRGARMSIGQVLRNQPRWSYFWRGAVMLVLAFLVAVLIGTPVHILLMEIDHATQAEIFGDLGAIYLRTYAVDWLASFLVSGTLTLTGFVFPATALGHPIGLWPALRASLRYARPVLVALVVLEITSFILIEGVGTRLRYVLFDYTGAGFLWAEVAIALAVGVPALQIKIGVLTNAYLHWRTTQADTAT